MRFPLRAPRFALPLFVCSLLLSPTTVAQEGGAVASPAFRAADADQLHLRYAQFDPARPLNLPEALRAPADSRLWIVQFLGLPDDTRRAALRELDVEIHGYLPANAYVVRMNAAVREQVAQIAGVRAAIPYHPAFRLEPFLVQELLAGNTSDVPLRRYQIVLVDKHRDRPALLANLRRVGAVVEHEGLGSILVEASMTAAQLRLAMNFDEVLWIDRWTEPELDMDNGRIQGGGNYVEQQGGFTGKGVNGHCYEGVEAGHQDFTNTPINVLSGGGPDSHGHCTGGIVFGNGTSHPGARGMAPDAQPFYTNRATVSSGYSRWQVIERLVKTHQVMFTTASWGGGRTRAYTSTSASTDDIIFDHDMAWTQSQSNAGNQDSRPEAWAKNIISIGGVAHRNNSNPADDSWQAGNGSTGPAADGRIKPDLCAYYDSILCSDLSGSAGYNQSGNYTTGFGGTSGATPMVAGHNAIAIQMFTDGLFGPQRVPNGTRWQNKPHFTTLKSLQIANAAQYSFSSSSNDNRREHVGWGFPDLKSMYDNRSQHYVVDETDILTQGTGMEYTIQVPSNRSELKISMSFADPAANPSSQITAINDLTLRVYDPNGKQYWGNVGLEQGNYSLPGGDRDRRNTVENVFVANPIPGNWKVEVIAYRVVQDSHVETTGMDADFGMVVNGGTFVSKKGTTVTVGSMTNYGTGCPGSRLPSATCMSINTSGSLAGSQGYPNVTYMLELTAPSPLKVKAFEIRLASRRSGSVVIPAYIYDANTQGQPNQVLATSSLNVQASEGLVTATLSQPVNIAQGQRFFIGFQNASSTITVGTLSSGTVVPYWRNNGTGNTWIRFTTRAWQYRVLCETSTGGVIPVLSSSSVPEIGAQYTVELRLSIPGTAGVLFTGFSDKTWASIPLPFDMAPFGASGCRILGAGDLQQGYPTNSLGEIDAPQMVPNDKAFVGFQLYHQWLVLDPKANQLGLVTTNATRAQVGG